MVRSCFMDGRMFLGGAWADGKGEKISVINPATGETIGEIHDADSTQIDTAIMAARNSFTQFSRLPAFKRAQMLKVLAALVRKNREKLARIMTTEQGKPLNESLGEIDKLADAFDFYAEEAVRVHGEIIPNNDDAFQSLVVREPIGVVVAITPWNYPAELVGWKLAASLAAGCTIVIKPPELTPFTVLEIARLAQQAGVPDGVVNVVTGKGSVVGQRLIEDKRVDKIAFTGSSAVGLKIMQSSTTVKRLSLELGGNCPMIVTAKADIKAAVKGAVRRTFRNMGQICIAINRIYVEREVYEHFLTRFKKNAEALVIANGLEKPDADLGAMASNEPLEKTKMHLQDALTKGARLISGGSAPEGAAFAKGFFFRPTIVADCTPDMKVMSEETFGPLVGVAPFDNLSEAVSYANDTQYGLASYVYTKSLDEMRYFSRLLDYGNVAVNNVDAGIINAPYGGHKQSGIGYEHGLEGMLEYFNFKHVRIHYDAPEGGVQ